MGGGGRVERWVVGSGGRVGWWCLEVVGGVWRWVVGGENNKKLFSP